MCTMFFITTLLLSISLVAWHQYNIDLTVDDAKQQKYWQWVIHVIIELGIAILLNRYNVLTYKVSFLKMLYMIYYI